MKTNLIAAAISGIVVGASSLAYAAPSHGVSISGDSGAQMLGDKHGCKGQNACKGQGGCKG